MVLLTKQGVHVLVLVLGCKSRFYYIKNKSKEIEHATRNRVASILLLIHLGYSSWNGWAVNTH